MPAPAEVLDARTPARRILEIVGDKWTPVVLYALRGERRRFSELQGLIPDISKKMLTQVLRSLERDGAVERTVYPVVPPHTDYRLTALGLLLREPVAMLCQWALEHEHVIGEVQRRRGGAAPRPRR